MSLISTSQKHQMTLGSPTPGKLTTAMTMPSSVVPHSKEPGQLDTCFTQAQRWHASFGQKPREELRPQLQRNRQQQASQKRTL